MPWTKGIGTEECKTIFHGESETDYQGRCVSCLSCEVVSRSTVNAEHEGEVVEGAHECVLGSEREG